MAERLAIDGGVPVRRTLLPYARPDVDEEDIAAVLDVLRSDWLTTGPKVAEFERVFAAAVGSGEAVAVSNGTAALHAAVNVIGIGPGDEVIVPAMTFAATANCIVYQGGTPVFADVDPDTLLIDPVQVEARITPRTRAIVAVDYAGQPCDYEPLRRIAEARGLHLLADACHSLGGDYRGRAVGTLADATAFSFHPVKNITSGEGGMITTDDAHAARRMREFRNHGMTLDHRQRERAGAWAYDVTALGYNYRLSDLHCALGISQLRKLPAGVRRRREIAAAYRRAFEDIPSVVTLAVRAERGHAHHLFVVLLDLEVLDADRAAIFAALRAEGIGVNVHYLPVHLHSFYRGRFATREGSCPVAEAAYARMLTLPLFSGMTDDEVNDVVEALAKVLRHHRRGAGERRTRS